MPLETRQIQGRHHRLITVLRAAGADGENPVDEQARTVKIAISSEEPVERWFGMETLDHSKGCVDLSRLKDAGPVLCDHDPSDIVGVLDSVSLDSDKVLRGVVRFGRSTRAQEVFQDVVDGIRTKISVGYDITEYTTTKGQNGAPDQIRATNWQPMECSFVAIPADMTVGVGRSQEPPSGNPASPTALVAVPPEVRMPEPTTPQAAPVAAPVNVDELRTKERADALQIRAMAANLGLVKEADELLASSKPLSEVRDELMGILATRQPVLAAPIVDLNAREAKQYSFARAMWAAVAAHESGKRVSSFEMEISDEIEKLIPATYRKQGGFFAPIQLQKRAGLDATNSTKGPEVVFTVPGEFIDLLRNYTAVVQRGARVLTGLKGPVSFPKQATAGSASWVAENPGSDVADSNLTFGSVSVSPKTLQSSTSYSRQLLAEESFDVESIVRQDLAMVHALAYDLAAIHGLGSANQPTGIYLTSGVGTKAMGSATPTFGKLQDMITTVANANALFGKPGWLTTPGMAGKLAQTLVASAAGSKMIWDGPYDNGTINGYSAVATNQVSALMSGTASSGGTEHGVIFGNWQDLLLAMWGALELVVDPYRLKKQGMIEVTTFQMADIAIRHAASFCVSTAATLT